jgi:hypothetical protein
VNECGRGVFEQSVRIEIGFGREAKQEEPFSWDSSNRILTRHLIIITIDEVY